MVSGGVILGGPGIAPLLDVVYSVERSRASPLVVYAALAAALAPRWVWSPNRFPQRGAALFLARSIETHLGLSPDGSGRRLSPDGSGRSRGARRPRLARRRPTSLVVVLQCRENHDRDQARQQQADASADEGRTAETERHRDLVWHRCGNVRSPTPPLVTSDGIRDCSRVLPIARSALASTAFSRSEWGMGKEVAKPTGMMQQFIGVMPTMPPSPREMQGFRASASDRCGLRVAD